jgi:hypothetical protein
MHIEILVEDQSGKLLLGHLLPKIIGGHGDPHTWKIHGYKGIGKLPKKLEGTVAPNKRILLDRLPSLLKGFGRTSGIDAVVVVLDNDDRDCAAFLNELKGLLRQCRPAPVTLFRLALEEIEAWYIGDKSALRGAYPAVRDRAFTTYTQDSCCGTWEVLADAIHPGGSQALKKAGWPIPGQIKCEWANRIGPLLDVEHNDSPSFGKLREGLRRAVSQR